MSWAGDDRERAEPERLTFPDLPRMELDQVLGQLVERAREVMGTQGRLRGLLRASQEVTGDLALPTLLRRIVEAARELLDARSAALGVLGADGQVAEFVHAGPDDAVDPRHPATLGVPIRVRGAVFGTLSLTGCHHDEFSDEDEQLALALAATAGQAIDNARLYETARKQQEWLRASGAIMRELLAARSGRPLDLIAGHTLDLADADLVTVLRPADGARLRVEVAVGLGAGELTGRLVDVAGTMSGQVFTTGAPLVASWADRPHPPDAPAVDLDAVLIVPLTGAGQVNGVLTAARKAGRPGFTGDDLEMAAGFAGQASVAIELADARAEQQRTELYDERDRIAAELHSQVVRRLFAIGLSLQTTAGAARSEVVARRVRTAIADLDAVITQIRETVFQLDDVLPRTTATVHDRVLEVLSDAGTEYGLAASTEFSGKLDAIASDDLADELVTTLQEGLRLIARHTGAGSVRVAVRSGAERLSVVLAHDGDRAFDRTPGTELARLAELASRRGGLSEVRERELTWWVPLS